MADDPNAGKQLEIVHDGVRYQRIPIKTTLVMPEDDITDIVTTFAADRLEDGDILFVTEKIVAITQGRSFPTESIAARPLAAWLSKRVTKTPNGIGLGLPQTMEMALRECGTPRILFAAVVAGVTKFFGRKGDFYRIAGPKARGIDGPTSGTIPPYNAAVVLAPDKPSKVAAELRDALGKNIEVMIVDMNDLGGNVLGSTTGRAGRVAMESILGDNPLGQGRQSTPMGIVRRIASADSPSQQPASPKTEDI